MAVDITRRHENAQGRVFWFGEVAWESYNKIFTEGKITIILTKGYIN